jgi:hypothetical protein
VFNGREMNEFHHHPVHESVSRQLPKRAEITVTSFVAVKRDDESKKES